MGRKGRDKFGAGPASRRRTVLQIEPVSRRKESEGTQLISRKREINPTSISGIGLLGQYAEDSDDEERKGSSGDERNMNEQETIKPIEEVQIDNKLSDFFKEIEAIGTEDSNSTEFTETTNQATDPTLDDQADTSTVDQNVQGYVLPEPWQQVCDPSTNYIYYWNTLTNEVSWELPQVFDSSQPPQVEVEITEQSTLAQKQTDSTNLIENQSSSSDKKASTERKDGTEEACEAKVISSYAGDDETVVLPIDGPAKFTSSDEVITPDQLAKESTSSSSGNLVGEYSEQEEKELGEVESSEESEKTKSSSISRKRERVAEIDMFESELRQDDSSESEKHRQKILDYWTEERIANAVPEEMPEYPSTPENLDISAPTSPDKHDKPPACELDGSDEPENTKRSDKEDVKNDEARSEVPAKKAKIEEESDHESEGDFAEKLLEEFLEGKPTDAPSSGDDMDVDSDEQQDGEAPLLPPEAFVHNRADRLKEEGNASPAAGVTLAQVEADKKKDEESEKLTTEIHDLCQLLSNKLQFLNINKEGVNKLLIVLVQMETRIKDWREGGLSSTYIVKKLREAAQELKSYEQSAVPEGWSCHWDSTYKRYFYTNDRTGESQWDYPQTTTLSLSVEKQQTSDADDVKGTWETSVVKETTSSIKPSSESHLYSSSLTAYALATPILVPTNVGHENSSLGTAISQTNYSMLTSSVDVDPAPVYPVFQPSQNTSSDVTKDPYRLDDDSPPVPENNRDHEPTPPPPGLSPPLPPLPDVQTIPPPPPPQDAPPLPPPDVSSVSEKSSNKAEQVNATGMKHGVIQRSLIDYSDLDSSSYPSNNSVQGSGSSRSSPIPMQIATKPKKKKSKSSSLPIRTSKVKQMSSLVQKWQAIKRQEEVLSEEESDEEDQAAKAEAQIKQWRQEQITSGLAADNPNFETIKGDWRERVRKAKKRASASTETEKSGS